MKKVLLSSILLLFFTAFFQSCDSKSTLAGKVEGTWAGTPERLIDSDVTSATIIKTMEFQRDGKATTGPFIFSGLISITTELPQNDSSFVQPVRLSAGGVATIQGTWSASDDDEIALMVDPSTLQVTVDTAGVVLTTNLLTGADTPELGAIKPALAEQLARQMRREVETQFFNARKIDDIKIKDNIMSCEINHRDMTLRKQTL